MKKAWLFLTLFLMSLAWPASAAIPATPVMTLYRFNGPLEIPYYSVNAFRGTGPSAPAGYLTQGTSVIPCLVIQNGIPLTNQHGTPYVGFQLVVNTRTATPAATERFNAMKRQQQATTVPHHHCAPGVRHVLDVRHLYAMGKAPFFDPPPASWDTAIQPASRSGLDRIVRAFHNSPQCQTAN